MKTRILTWFLASAWLATSTGARGVEPEITLAVSLSPAGSFEATSKKITVKGGVVQIGESYQAEEVELDLASLKTGIALRDTHMRENYFETAKYPKAILRRGRGKDGRFTAELIIRNVAVPVQGTYKIEGGRIVTQFTTTLSAFKIRSANYMGVGVDDEVVVQMVYPLTSVARVGGKNNRSPASSH